MDAWGVDALVMGSQKCLAAPPGLSAVALSKTAYESLHSDSSFYANLKAHSDALAKQDTPYTPAVPLFLAFREALRLLKEEGLENRIARTRRLAEAARAGVDALGLRLYPDRRFASNTVAAIRYPAGVDDNAFRKELRERHGTGVAGGQGPLKGQISRRDEHDRPAIGGHSGDHLLQSAVAGHPAPEQDLLVVQVGHRPFGHLREHRERDLLDRERDVLHRRALLPEREGRGEHPTERDVHSLHAVRQGQERLPVPRKLLEDRSSGEGEAALPGELVEHVADVDLGEVDSGQVRRFADQRDHRLRVVVRRLTWMDAPFLGSHHIIDVREDAALLVHDAHADRVGGPFDAEGEHSAS